VVALFSLGDYRKYSATAHFISGVPPNGDLRNGTDPTILNAVMRTSSQWIQPLQYGSYPYIVKYNDSTRFADMVDFGSIMLGEPGVLTFFTRGMVIGLIHRIGRKLYMMAHHQVYIQVKLQMSSKHLLGKIIRLF